MMRQEEVSGSSEVVMEAVRRAIGRGGFVAMVSERRGREFVTVAFGKPMLHLNSWSDVQQVINALRECGAQAFGPLPSEG